MSPSTSLIQRVCRHSQTFKPNPRLGPSRARFRGLSILHVSNGIHKEAEEVLYYFNTFEFKGPSGINDLSAINDLILFLQSTSDRVYRNLIRHIIIRWPCATAEQLKPPIDFLIGCQGLKSLTMTNLPLWYGKIPKSIQTWMICLRVDAIKFPDISPEMSSDLTQIIEGNGTEREKGQKKRACEKRELKVIHLFHR